MAQTQIEKRFIDQDSIPADVNQNYRLEKTTGTYAVVVDDTISRQLFNGVNVSNMLRGHVPNLAVGPYIGSDVNGLRNVRPIYVVDGIAFSNEFPPYYSLNTFNFGSISSVSTGNALALFGGLGSSGGIILESKSGKNISKAMFEANSTTAFLSTDQFEVGQISLEGSNRWMFSKAIAFAQDFGKVDTRVSYTATYFPDGSNAGKDVNGSHAVKINTGIEFSQRFLARVVADGFYHVDRYVNDDIDDDDVYRSLVGTVSLRYLAADWVTLTSQTSLNRARGTMDASSAFVRSSAKDDPRRALTNVMANFHPKTSSSFEISWAAGMQLERQIVEQSVNRYSSSNSSGSYLKGKAKTRTWLGNMNVKSWRFFETNFNYRYDYQVDAGDNMTDPSTWSIGSQFNFSDAFSLSKKVLTSGLLRGTVGKSNAVETPGYPNTNSRDFMITNLEFGNYFVDSNLTFTSRKSAEIGIDLLLFDSRLSIQSTYFRTHDNQTLGLVIIPFGGNGFAYRIADIGKSNVSGFEGVVGYRVYSQKRTMINTKVIFGKARSRVDLKDNPLIMLNYQDTRIPDWTSSILTQFRFNRVFAHVLCTHQSGGGFTTYEFPQTETYRDLTQTWLKDVAIGYSFANVSISLSGRDLFELYAKMSDHELYDGFRIQKTVMLSGSIKF